METLLNITDTKEAAGVEIIAALSSAKAGANLVYFRGAAWECPKNIKVGAAKAYLAGLGELCQRPSETYNKKGYRIWDYIIQKAGN